MIYECISHCLQGNRIEYTQTHINNLFQRTGLHNCGASLKSVGYFQASNSQSETNAACDLEGEFLLPQESLNFAQKAFE